MFAGSGTTIRGLPSDSFKSGQIPRCTYLLHMPSAQSTNLWSRKSTRVDWRTWTEYIRSFRSRSHALRRLTKHRELPTHCSRRKRRCGCRGHSADSHLRQQQSSSVSDTSNYNTITVTCPLAESHVTGSAREAGAAAELAASCKEENYASS